MNTLWFFHALSLNRQILILFPLNVIWIELIPFKEKKVAQLLLSDFWGCVIKRIAFVLFFQRLTLSFLLKTAAMFWGRSTNPAEWPMKEEASCKGANLYPDEGATLKINLCASVNTSNSSRPQSLSLSAETAENVKNKWSPLYPIWIFNPQELLLSQTSKF